jgi:hypothetical protein
MDIKFASVVALGAIVFGQSVACGAAAPAPKAPTEKEPKAVVESGQKLEERSTAQPVMQKPEWIPSEAREMLAARMRRHGEEMMFLVVSVLILSYDSAESMALEIAAEPRIGRPGVGERGTINALLPSHFFEYQDELRERADALSDAAHEKDHERMVRAYGKLAETCVGCHAAYMEAEPPSEELED